MSQPVEGMHWEPPVAPIRDASAVILVREAEGESEVFWVRRGKKVSFSAGFYAFPGGRLDEADRRTPIAGAEGAEAALRVAAIREVFEETGVLLAPGADRLPAETLASLRRALLDGASFPALLEAQGLSLDAGVLTPAGRWLTPAFSPLRYDTRFFLARLPAGASASVHAGELQQGAWIRPAEALRRWERGEALLHPPNHHALAVLAGFAPEAAVPLLRRPPFLDAQHVVRRIEFQRGILYYPLRTPTLPPATHTNCYVVGTGEVVLIDPGSPYPEEQERIAAAIEELVGEGRRVKAILLSHHHPDHVGGAEDLGRRLGVPIWTSAATAERLRGGTAGAISREAAALVARASPRARAPEAPTAVGCLQDGDRIELDGPMPMRLRCLLTEGHARGHLCFLDEGSGALIAGDMVAEASTILIDPPEGDLQTYLDSLRRLRALPARVIYPAHGFPLPDGAAVLERTIAHREQRLEQIRTALAAAKGPLSLADLVETVYSDTPRQLYPVAERSALASLLLLEREGRATRVAEAWAAAPAS